MSQNYGYIRVQVSQNPTPPQDHIWPMSLFANGNPVGQSFAHASHGFVWTALSVNHLSAKSSRTPISANYGSIGQNRCEFNFEIFFSFTPEGAGISLGTFLAPLSSSLGSLPIGLHCKGKYAEVCSDDPSIQKKLTTIQTKARIDDYNRWKKEYDQKIKDAQEALANEQAELDSAVDNAKIETTDSPTAEENHAKTAADDLKQQNEVESQAEIEALAEATIDDTTSPELLAENAAEVILQAKRDRLRKAIDAKRDELSKNPIGAMLVAYNDLTGMMEELILMDREVARQERIEGNADAAFEASVNAAQTEWAAFLLSHNGPLGEGAKAGIKLIAGKPVKVCEAITGLESCFGRELTFTERVESAVEVATAPKEIFDKIEDSVEEKVIDKAKEVFEIADGLKANMEEKPYVAKLILNEVVDGNGKIVTQVMNKMSSNQIPARPVTLSLDGGDRAVIRPLGDNNQWSIEIQNPSSNNDGKYISLYTLQVTIDSDGKIKLHK